MNDKELRAKAVQVADMSIEQIDSFSEQVSLSQVDDKARFYLFEAIDKRREQLDKVSVMAVDSDVKMDGDGVEI